MSTERERMAALIAHLRANVGHYSKQGGATGNDSDHDWADYLLANWPPAAPREPSPDGLRTLAAEWRVRANVQLQERAGMQKAQKVMRAQKERWAMIYNECAAALESALDVQHPVAVSPQGIEAAYLASNHDCQVIGGHEKWLPRFKVEQMVRAYLAGAAGQ